MVFNLILASIGVGLGYVFLGTKQPLFKFIIFLLWILFLPNTIYLLTDLQHLPDQFYRIDNEYKITLMFQYVLLLSFGIIIVFNPALCPAIIFSFASLLYELTMSNIFCAKSIAVLSFLNVFVFDGAYMKNMFSCAP